MLEARHVTVRYDRSERPAVEDTSVSVESGRLVAVVGPNGSGKTTLIRALMGTVRLSGGEVLLDGRSIASWSASLRARSIAAVAQREEYPFAWKVQEVVEFGRYPWLSELAPLRPEDHQIVARSLDRADVAGLTDRRIDTLSGGEWQRVRIARALAQMPRVLILDEPTASLDLGHEMEIFELVRQLVDEGLAGLVVTHHLNLAARFADRMILMSEGRPAAEGTAAEVLDPDRLARVFAWPIEVSRTAEGVPQVQAARRKGGHSRGR